MKAYFTCASVIVEENGETLRTVIISPVVSRFVARYKETPEALVGVVNTNQDEIDACPFSVQSPSVVPVGGVSSMRLVRGVSDQSDSYRILIFKLRNR